MKVILNDFVENLGERGDTVEVKPGYARNFLLPRGLAYNDTPGNRKRFAQEQRTWEQMDFSRRSSAEKAAAALKGAELHFQRRAGENEVLFGSVSVVDIARELSERGFEVERRRILLAEPIKSLGRFEVAVQVHRDIQVTVPVHVTRPGEQAVAGGAETPAEAAELA
jgi:large subunit ribosomal protein L9